MSSPSSRRFKRINIGLPCVVAWGRTQLRVITRDISQDGMYLRCDTYPPTRAFLRVQFRSPDDEDPIHLTGMALHTHSPQDSDEPPGFGLQLYGNDPRTRDRWHRLVVDLENQHPDALATKVQAFHRTAEVVMDAVRRAYPRHPAHLQVQIRDIDELMSMVTHDISKGGTLVLAEHLLAPGEEVVLDIVHPVSRNVFDIAGVVRRVVNEPDIKGMGIEFKCTDECRAAMWRFVSDHIEHDDVVIYDEITGEKLE